MKLYKFRPLLDCTSFKRVAEILETGQFWCSPLWEQNDPMEAVYYNLRESEPNGTPPDLFDEKNRYRICSFSGVKALTKPLMWGYYAGGFKGVAIEIEAPLDDKRLHNVSYEDVLPEFRGDPEAILKVLTTKLKAWEHEFEHRFLIEVETGMINLGKITAVYFGNPYGSVENQDQVVEASNAVRDYMERAERLRQIARAHGYPIGSATLSGDGNVKIEPPTNDQIQ